MSSMIVVGAGLAGLIAARELVLQGHDLQIVESAERAGGGIEQLELAGIPLDVGAAWFDPRDGAVASLLARVTNAPAAVEASPERWWIEAGSSALPLPQVTIEGVPAAPLSQECVEVVGRSAAWRGMLDAVLPGPYGANSATLGGLVRARMGDGIVERLMVPVVRATRGVHPDALPLAAATGMRHALLQQNSLGRAVTHLALDRAPNDHLATLDGGMSALVDALLAELDRFGVPVRLGCRVDAVADAGDGRGGTGDAGLRIDGTWVEGEVVVAAPLESGGIAGETTVGTIVFDESVVPARHRGAGVLGRGDADGGLRRATEVSALWSMGPAAAGRVVLRVEVVGRHELAHLVAEIGRCWGLSLDESSVLDAHVGVRPDWPVPSTVAATPGSGVGEWVDRGPYRGVIAEIGAHHSGTGVHRVVAHTLEAMRRLAAAAAEAASASATSIDNGDGGHNGDNTEPR